MNTMLIIANQGSNSNSYAAGLCANLTVTEGGNTYGDWYLPSKYELDLLDQNKLSINQTATVNGGTTLSSYGYWSSTEYDNLRAWKQNLGDDQQGLGQKNTTEEYVRAVRTF